MQGPLGAGDGYLAPTLPSPWEVPWAPSADFPELVNFPAQHQKSRGRRGVRERCQLVGAWILACQPPCGEPGGHLGCLAGLLWIAEPAGGRAASARKPPAPAAPARDCTQSLTEDHCLLPDPQQIPVRPTLATKHAEKGILGSLTPNRAQHLQASSS